MSLPRGRDQSGRHIGTVLQRWCALAFPRRFREARARDLFELYLDLYGHLPAPVFWFAVVRDSITEGLAERFANARRKRRRTRANLIRALADDAGYAFRSLRKSPGFSTLSSTSLALGIGLNLAIFAAVYAVLISPPPFHRGSDLVSLDRFDAAAGSRVGVSPTEIAEFEEQMESLDAVVEYHAMSFTLLGKGFPERLRTGVVSHDFFELLGIEPVVGRGFMDLDEGEGAEPVILLSYEYWKSGFDRDPSVVGRSYQMNDMEHRIIGVLPPLPQFPQANDIFITASSCPFRFSDFTRTTRSSRMTRAFGRLAPGVALASAGNEFSRINAEMGSEYPESFNFPRGLTSDISRLEDMLTLQARPMLLALFATSLLLFFAVCTNLANMSLSRSIKRAPEWALRYAMGSGKGRIANQLALESIMTSGMGGILGMLVATLSMGPLVSLLSPLTPRAFEIGIGWPIVVVTLFGSLATGLVFGALPAWLAVDTSSSSKAGSHNHTASTGRGVLVSVQVGVALTLLIASALTLKSFLALQRQDTGFAAGSDVYAGQVYLDWNRFGVAEGYEDPNGFYLPLLGQLVSDPDVGAAALSTSVPLFGSFSNIVGITNPKQPSDTVFASQVRIAGHYFDLMGVSLAGADLSRDSLSDHPLAVLSLSSAATLFGDDDPIGQHVSMVYNGSIDSIQVVGVAEDVSQATLREGRRPGIYLPLTRYPARAASVVARVSGDSTTARMSVLGAMAAIDSDQPLSDFKLVAQARNDLLKPPMLTALMVMGFGFVAVVITSVGLAGVIGYGVISRKRELGIRIALGARRSRVMALVMRQGVVMTIVGVVVGLPFAVAISLASREFLFEVSPLDQASYVLAAGLVVVVALLACWIPARRATEIDPVSALRSE